MAEKGKRGKGEAKAELHVPQLLKSDDVTGRYKEGEILLMKDLPDEYQQAYNNAWNVSNCALKMCTFIHKLHKLSICSR